MKHKFFPVLALFICWAAIVRGQDAGAPDKHKVSYALGANLAMQIKQMNADVDVDAIARGLQDELGDKPTQVKESELRLLFRQEEAAARAKMSLQNLAEGPAYLARNAGLTGVKVAPDGLQYQIIKPGMGESPKTSDTVNLDIHGALLDGTDFVNRDNVQLRISTQPKGLQEALTMMKPDAKWHIALPPELGYGHEGFGRVGPDAIVVYDLHLISIATAANPPRGGNGAGLIGGPAPGGTSK